MIGKINIDTTHYSQDRASAPNRNALLYKMSYIYISVIDVFTFM